MNDVEKFIKTIVTEIETILTNNNLPFTKDSHIPVPDWYKGYYRFYNDEQYYSINFGLNWSLDNNQLNLNLFKIKTNIKSNEFYLDRGEGTLYLTSLKQTLDTWLNSFELINSKIKYNLTLEDFNYSILYNIIKTYNIVDFPR